MPDVPARSRSTRPRAAGLGREAALYFRLAGAGDGAVAAEAAAEGAAGVRELADGLDWDAFRLLARRDGTTAAVRRRPLPAGGELPGPVPLAVARAARARGCHRPVLHAPVP